MSTVGCYKVWCDYTRAERSTNTIEWFPHQTAMPTPTNLDMIHATAKVLLQQLLKPQTNSPLHPLTNLETTKLTTLADIFKQKTIEPSPVTSESEISIYKTTPKSTKNSPPTSSEGAQAKLPPCRYEGEKTKNKNNLTSRIGGHINFKFLFINIISRGVNVIKIRSCEDFSSTEHSESTMTLGWLVADW